MLDLTKELLRVFKHKGFIKSFVLTFIHET